MASHETSPAMAGDAVVDTNVNTTKRRDHVRTPETGSPADASDGKGDDAVASYDDHPGMTRVSENDDSSERSLDFFSESGGKPNHRMLWYAADYAWCFYVQHQTRNQTLHELELNKKEGWSIFRPTTFFNEGYLEYVTKKCAFSYNKDQTACV
uniref:Uncharacterized protein n=1 Tax=Peronospora matthiolae TaxID=2874970 RepID=A0AAV1UEP2_9STRA